MKVMSRQIIPLLLVVYRVLMYFLPPFLQNVGKAVYLALFILFLAVSINRIKKKTDFFALFTQLLRKVALVILILAVIDLSINLLINDTTHITGIIFTSINIHLMIVVLAGITTFIFHSVKKRI